jgi:hypothetical protein
MKKLKKIVLLPVYIASIFTGAKSFKDNPIIGSRVLNLLGLHPARMILSHSIFSLRQLFLAGLATKAERLELKNNGFILKENFLPQELFERVASEAKNFHGTARQCIQGNTITKKVFLDGRTIENLPAINELLNDQNYLRLLKYASARATKPLFYIQQIQNNFKDRSGADPQKNLHIDTFHPTMKAWLFLEDVTPEMGPFTFVRGSNRPSFKLLKFYYRKSINAKNLNDKYSEKGSIRISDDERKELGLPEPQGFAVKANTLVVANTFGFHRRGDVAAGKRTRLEIWAYSRPNPFSPFIGIDAKPLRKLRDNAFKYYLQKQEQKAIKLNRRPTWESVKAEGF